MGHKMLGRTAHHESLGHGRRMKPTRTERGEKLKDGLRMDEGWEDEGWIKDAVWQWHSDSWIQPRGKHPKTFRSTGLYFCEFT